MPTSTDRPAATATAVPDDASGTDLILDAARATVLDFGLRRTTVTEVARRSGLSRMTVYRRYADQTELMRALMSREFSAMLQLSQQEAAALDTGLARALSATMHTVELLLSHPLLLRLLELEPELLVPYLSQRVGRFQILARESLAVTIAEGQRDRSIRPGDPAALAATIETAARGLVLSARALTRAERATGLRELEQMLGSYLHSGTD